MSAACTVVGSLTEPGGCVTTPTVPPQPTSSLIPTHLVPVAHHVASLPFTGADIGELLGIGISAVAVGLLLKLRRRTA